MSTRDGDRCPTEMLSDYLDGSLSAEEAGGLRRHLDGCSSCQTVLEELKAVRDWAGSLQDREPERDLWPGIRDVLDERQVIDLNTRMGGRERPGTGSGRGRGRGVFLSIPQLSAAAAALVVLTAGGSWALLAPGTSSSASAPALLETAVSEPAVTEGSPPVARLVGLQDSRVEAYLSEVEELETILDQGRSTFEPNTVRILERNLELIDRAIRESIEALAIDPGNAFVEEYLRRSYERKVSYLREATALLDLTD